jgi:hypothetical protein
LRSHPPYARVPNELCGFVAGSSIELRAADDPNLSSAGEAKACRNRRTGFIAGVDACLKVQDLFELLFCFAWQQPTQILTLEGEIGGHEPSADPQRFSEQTMVRPSVANGAAFGTRLL